jgi:hypothetical protein
MPQETPKAVPAAASQSFPLGDVLTIVTGLLLSQDGIAAAYRILNFITKDNLYTHQLPRVCAEVRPYLLKKHPALATVDASGVTPENWRVWMTDQVLAFGEYLEVDQMPAGEHYYIDPVSELVEAGVHPSKIVLVPTAAKGARNA